MECWGGPGIRIACLMYSMSFSFSLARPTGRFLYNFWHGNTLIPWKEVLSVTLPFLLTLRYGWMDGWIASVCVSMLWLQYVFLLPISLQKVLLWSQFPVCDITSQYLSSSPCLTNTTQLNLTGMNGGFFGTVVSLLCFSSYQSACFIYLKVIIQLRLFGSSPVSLFYTYTRTPLYSTSLLVFQLVDIQLAITPSLSRQWEPGLLGRFLCV